MDRLIDTLSRSHARALAVLFGLTLLFFVPGQFTLQPMDRDEPRFAQASKQMMETGDYVDIRFQEEARHKKPVGIYWMQVAAVKLAEAAGAKDARGTIGYYRIPSLIGAMLVVGLTYWTALAFLARPAALMAAALMAGSILLGVEARLAKTDAVLAATVVAAMGALARSYFAFVSPDVRGAPGLGTALVFWIAIGIGILVKGPITPLIPLIVALFLAWRERSFAWLKPMRPAMGLAIVLAIALPWLVAIAIKSGGSFFAESVGKDMLGKVGSVAEKHWGPPGSYFFAFWATFWPGAPLVALTGWFWWSDRKDDAVTFLLAWILPMWLVLEAMPTKLPHYVLPLYPAIAILIVLAAERGELLKARWAQALAAFLMVLVPLVFLIGAPGLFYIVEEGAPLLRLPFLALPFLLIAALVGGYAAWLLFRSGTPVHALLLALFAALSLTFGAYLYGLPMLKAFNLSPRLAAAAKASGCANPAFASVGYREPSLVFLSDTKIRLADAKEAAAFIEAEGVGCRIAFVERQHEEAFRAALQGKAAPALVTRVRGVNINAAVDKQRRLRVLDIAVYVRR